LSAGIVIVFLILIVGSGCTGKVKKPDILLITIDTLRRDRLGCYGYPGETSPFIDRLAAGGLVFKNVITPIPLTDGSHASILTSQHPLVHQVIRNASPLNPKLQTIAIGTIAVNHLGSKYHFSQGFDSFSDTWDPALIDWQEEVKSFKGEWQRIAMSVNKSVKEQVREYLAKDTGKPFFLWVHYYDPHFPYINRKEIAIKSSAKGDPWKSYDREIRYTDNHIEELYGFLGENGLSEKMITCITADHGEQLGEHDYVCDHVDFYSETTFVPLIFHGTKIPRGKIVEEYVSTMDIAVTLLKLVNLEFKSPVRGINLLEPDGNPKTPPQRDFLIIGNPLFIRSIQLIFAPYSYILNFDFSHRSWFVSLEDGFPENRFQNVPEQRMNIKHVKKDNYYEFRVKFPHQVRRGLNYCALRFDVNEGSKVFLSYKIKGSKWSDTYVCQSRRSSENKKIAVTAYFPLTPLDRLTGAVGIKEKTRISGLRYAFLSETECLKYLENSTKIKNERVFSILKSTRKFKKTDELYNLSRDMKMIRNLLPVKKKWLAKAVEMKKKIYDFLSFYLKETTNLLGETRPGKLTPKEKEMLKSLGYL
jgi:hypothetical protein